MLNVSVSSTREIARFWGIADKLRIPATSNIELKIAAAGRLESPEPALPKSKPTDTERAGMLPASGVGAIIEHALRAAGLMR